MKGEEFAKSVDNNKFTLRTPKIDGFYVLARDVQKEFGYIEWRNFEGVIKRAIQIIINTQSNGVIQKTTKKIIIGSGALREIVDYKIDKNGLLLIKKLTSSQKLNNIFEIRNETIFLQLIQKYCIKTDIKFEYQFTFLNYRYDCKIGNNLLIEFDEPHHLINTKQKVIDINKSQVAIENKFKIFRINLEMDIIDVILFIQNNI
jgi:hypothetical protein